MSDELLTLPDVWTRWRAEFCLAQLGMAEPDVELAGAEADQAVAILLPERGWFVRARLVGEFPQVDPSFTAVLVERVGGTRTHPLIARLPCRTEDL